MAHVSPKTTNKEPTSTHGTRRGLTDWVIETPTD